MVSNGGPVSHMKGGQEWSEGHGDPSGQFLRILDMGSKSANRHAIYFAYFLRLVFSLLDGIGWYMMVLNCLEWFVNGIIRLIDH